jgi:hypothetical protein
MLKYFWAAMLRDQYRFQGKPSIMMIVVFSLVVFVITLAVSQSVVRSSGAQADYILGCSIRRPYTFLISLACRAFNARMWAGDLEAHKGLTAGGNGMCRLAEGLLNLGEALREVVRMLGMACAYD